MGTWRTLYPRRILHALDDISVHCSLRQASLEPGPSGQELRTRPTGQLRFRISYVNLADREFYNIQLTLVCF